MIKNAANEGADAIKHIVRELNMARALSRKPSGRGNHRIGPAGLSAAIAASQFNLRYVGIEQDKVLRPFDAIQRQYVFFKPDTMDSRGTIEVNGPGEQREGFSILDLTMNASGVRNQRRRELQKGREGHRRRLLCRPY